MKGDENKNCVKNFATVQESHFNTYIPVYQRRYMYMHNMQFAIGTIPL